MDLLPPELAELHRRLSALVTPCGMSGADTVDLVGTFFEEIGMPLPDCDNL